MAPHRAAIHGPDFTVNFVTVVRLADNRIRVRLVQQFAVPVNATRLFLGISDAPGYHGAAGAYDDNAGSFVATFNIPEPTVPALLMFALAAMLVQWPRRLR